jgi:hypothetical protein
VLWDCSVQNKCDPFGRKVELSRAGCHDLWRRRLSTVPTEAFAGDVLRHVKDFVAADLHRQRRDIDHHWAVWATESVRIHVKLPVVRHGDVVEEDNEVNASIAVAFPQNVCGPPTI